MKGQHSGKELISPSQYLQQCQTWHDNLISRRRWWFSVIPLTQSDNSSSVGLIILPNSGSDTLVESTTLISFNCLYNSSLSNLQKTKVLLFSFSYSSNIETIPSKSEYFKTSWALSYHVINEWLVFFVFTICCQEDR